MQYETNYLICVNHDTRKAFVWRASRDYRAIKAEQRNMVIDSALNRLNESWMIFHVHPNEWNAEQKKAFLNK